MTATILHLPVEIMMDILGLLPDSATLHCSLTCRQWQDSLRRQLYRSPRIRSTEAYLQFVETLVDRRPGYGEEVRVLDLRRVNGTLKTVRLPEVMRLCRGLRAFYSPQAAFTPAMMQVLPVLARLQVLDLECTIERFEMSRVMHACAELQDLHTFLYPRCAVSTLYPIKRYPPALDSLALRGGIRDDFVAGLAQHHHPSFPDETSLQRHLSRLTIAYAPSITADPMLVFISTLTRLEVLSVHWPLMRFSHNSLDSLLLRAPGLKVLSLAIDYISPRFFEIAHAKLESLHLTFSGVGKHTILSAEDILEAVDREEDHYPRLEHLCVGRKLDELIFRETETSEVEAFRAILATRGIHYQVAPDDDDSDAIL